MEQEEILARLETKFTEWRPTERQSFFLSVPYDVFEVLYGGALGGGKSEVGLIYPLVSKTIITGIQLYEHPAFIGIIFRRTYQQLEKSLIPRAKLMYEAVGAKYNETKKLFEFPDKNGVEKAGGKVFLSHMENEKDVLQHDTNEYNYVFIDQAEQFTEFQLRYISSRVRRSNPDLPAVYRLSANPGGVSHTYLRKRYIEPAREGHVLLIDKITNTSRMFVPAKLEDNPHLEENDPDYRNRLQLLPESERAAKISGDWFTFSGQKFSEFRFARIPGEPDNALHICQPFLIPPFWPRVLAIDWGYKALTFAIWAAISPQKRAYIYRCYSVKGKTTRVWAADIGRLSQDENIVRNPLDPSAWQERGHEMTIAQEYEVYSGMVPEKADNDRISGVQAIHEYLRFTSRPVRRLPATGYNQDVAMRIMRLQGLQKYEEYMSMFKEEEPETNLPLLQIFEPTINTGTKLLIETIPIAQYSEKHKEDYEEFDGDDPLDTLRYLLKSVTVYIDDILSKTNYFEKEAAIVQDLVMVGDMTSYYMRMDKLEADIKLSNPCATVRRYGSYYGRHQ
jgi:phage terminase large subunit